MCTPNIEYQLVNPSTQIALYAECIDTCDIQENITWNIYYGEINSSSNAPQWMLFSQLYLYDNIWFFGKKIIFCSSVVDGLFREKYKQFYSIKGFVLEELSV